MQRKVAKPAEPAGGKMNGLHKSIHSSLRRKGGNFHDLYREIALDYLTDEKHYPFGTKDEYFKASEPEPEMDLIIRLKRAFFSNA